MALRPTLLFSGLRVHHSAPLVFARLYHALRMDIQDTSYVTCVHGSCVNFVATLRCVTCVSQMPKRTVVRWRRAGQYVVRDAKHLCLSAASRRSVTSVVVDCALNVSQHMFVLAVSSPRVPTTPAVKHVTLSFPGEPRYAAVYSATTTSAWNAWTATLTAVEVAAQHRGPHATSAVWSRPRHVCRFAQSVMPRSASTAWRMDTYAYA